jgi:hypothetical protein
VDIKNIVPPRAFVAGFPENRVTLKDCAHITLAPDEQVTFFTEYGSEYDVTRKDWGFYMTPSLNSRLPRYNLRAVCVKNRNGQFFILAVENGKENLFEEYMRLEKMQIITWLDNQESLDNLEKITRN